MALFSSCTYAKLLTFNSACQAIVNQLRLIASQIRPGFICKETFTSALISMHPVCIDYQSIRLGITSSCACKCCCTSLLAFLVVVLPKILEMGRFTRGNFTPHQAHRAPALEVPPSAPLSQLAPVQHTLPRHCLNGGITAVPHGNSHSELPLAERVPR
jgi:hypothetical protein